MDRIELERGCVKAKQLKEWINLFDDNEDILIMMEDCGVGGNASYLDFSEVLQGEEKQEAIENYDIWNATLWVGIE